MADPKKVLMTIAADKPPSLAEAAALLGVAVADLNAAFGVVPVDRDQGLYPWRSTPTRCRHNGRRRTVSRPLLLAPHRPNGHAAKQIVVRRGSRAD